MHIFGICVFIYISAVAGVGVALIVAGIPLAAVVFNSLTTATSSTGLFSNGGGIPTRGAVFYDPHTGQWLTTLEEAKYFV